MRLHLAQDEAIYRQRRHASSTDPLGTPEIGSVPLRRPTCSMGRPFSRPTSSISSRSRPMSLFEVQNDAFEMLIDREFQYCFRRPRTAALSQGGSRCNTVTSSVVHEDYSASPNSRALTTVVAPCTNLPSFSHAIASDRPGAPGRACARLSRMISIKSQILPSSARQLPSSGVNFCMLTTCPPLVWRSISVPDPIEDGASAPARRLVSIEQYLRSNPCHC